MCLRNPTYFLPAFRHYTFFLTYKNVYGPDIWYFHVFFLIVFLKLNRFYILLHLPGMHPGTGRIFNFLQSSILFSANLKMF